MPSSQGASTTSRSSTKGTSKKKKSIDAAPAAAPAVSTQPSQSGVSFEGQRTEVKGEAHAEIQQAIRNNADAEAIRGIIQRNALAAPTPANMNDPALTAMAQKHNKELPEEQQNVPEKKKWLGMEIGPVDRPFTMEDANRGIGGGALIFSAITGGLALAGTRLLSSGGLAAPSVARAASGKIVSRFGTAAQTAAANSKTGALTTSYLGKLVQSAKRPRVVLGLILGAGGLGASVGSYFYGMVPNERGDTAQNYGIAHRDAVQAGDKATADALYQDILDATDPQVVEGLNALNYPKAAADKLKGLRKTATLRQEMMEKKSQKDSDWQWNGEKWVRGPLNGGT